MASVEAAVALAVFLLIRFGQISLLAGSVRSKNAAGVAMRLLLDLAAITLAIWLIGGLFIPVGLEEGWVFWSHLLGISPHTSAVVAMLLPPAVIIGGALIGGVAERSRMVPALVTSMLLSALALPLVWRIDASMPEAISPTVSGLGIAVLMGGAAALAGAWMTGPRKGKYNRDLSVNFVPGHNVFLQIAGLMAFALGFSAAGANAVNTLLSLSAATLAAALFGQLRFGKIDVGITIAGALGGICASAAGATTMPGYAAVLAGLIAGVAVPWTLLKIETHFRIDDVTAATSSHLTGGLIGLLVAGLLSHGSFSERLGGLAGNLIVGVLAVAVAGAITYGVLGLFAKRNALRVSETAEFDGTDLAELDVNAYPDFQQTMIKSYHLREL